MHMRRGEKDMKCLRIDHGKGQFIDKTGNYVDIDKMGKDDILYLLDVAIDEKEVFEMDDMAQNDIANPAHKVIYQNLSEKFADLLSQKKQFLDESENIFKDAIQKYKT